MNEVYTSSILIQIGTSLANSHSLRDLAIRHFGRGIKVVVGGYAQKLAADDDAPFIWVYSEEDDSNVNGEGAVGFTAKIVLGICPQKDVPSIDVMFDDANDLIEKTNAVQAALVSVLGTLEEGSELYESVEAVVSASEEKRDDAVTSLDEAKEAAAGGEYETMFSKLTAERTNAANVTASVATVAELVGEEEGSAAEIAAAVAAAAVATASSTTLATEQAKVSAAFASFIEDPFISEVVAERTSEQSGLIIYGAIRTIDIFKNQIINVLNHIHFGIPLESVKFKNQAVAHYPLDWSEITAHFQNTETLGL